MKNKRLLDLIGEIDDRHIAEAAPAAGSPAKRRWVRRTAAACVCLAGFGIAAAVNSGLLSGRVESSLPPAAPAPYRVELIGDSSGDVRWDPAHVQLIGTNEGICLPGCQKTPAGTASQEVAVFVAPMETPPDKSDEMRLEEAEKYAYLDLDSASEEIKEKILDARRIIIFHSRWVADGYSGNIVNVITGEVEPLPTFSELFPGWDLPVYDTAEEQVTQDGLGADCLYGLELTVLQVDGGFLRGAAREPTNRFSADQTITVYPPADLPLDTFGLEVGDSVFVSYYGKDCSLRDSVIRADDITHTSPFDPVP